MIEEEEDDTDEEETDVDERTQKHARSRAPAMSD